MDIKVNNIDDLNKALADQFAQKIREKFERGEYKKYCSVCKCEQTLILVNDIEPTCPVCGNKFELDIKYKSK